MRKYHHWNKKDETIIQREVAKNVINITEGLKNASEKLNLPFNAVKAHYYKVIQKSQRNKIFFIFSFRKKALNYKVIKNTNKKKSHITQIKNSLWKRIIEVFTE